MKDRKEQDWKERFDSLAVRMMKSYHDFMMNRKSLKKHIITEQKLLDFIEQEIQKAEKRGYENAMKLLKFAVEENAVERGLEDMIPELNEFGEKIMKRAEEFLDNLTNISDEED